MNIAILGIGNILLRDDGIGIHVINQLEELSFDQHIKIIDGGTSIFDLLSVFAENDKIIVIDSLKGGYEPGTIYKITPQQLGSYLKSSSSLHDVQIMDLLKNINLMSYYPEVIIVGVEPAEIYYDLELSDVLKAQVPQIIEIIKQEISSMLS